MQTFASFIFSVALLYCFRTSFLYATSLFNRLFVGFILGHLEVSLTLDDDATVLVVLCKRLNCVALPVNSNVGCIDAVLVYQFVGNALGTLLGESLINFGITRLYVGIAGDKDLGIGIGLNQVGSLLDGYIDALALLHISHVDHIVDHFLHLRYLHSFDGTLLLHHFSVGLVDIVGLNHFFDTFLGRLTELIGEADESLYLEVGIVVAL